MAARASTCIARAALLTVVVALCAAAPTAQAAPVLPAGFDDQLVTNGVPAPTALAFTPDGRMLVADKAGRLYVYKDGALLSTAALDISSRVCSNSERGLLGLAVDPAFTPTSDNYVYLFYSFKKFGVCDNFGPVVPVNRVSRFTLGSDDLVDPDSELILIDNISPPSDWHNGGDLHFGKDGYLYVSAGDGSRGDGETARNQSTLLGKILRITRDGDVPSTNPFQGTGTDRCNVTGSTQLENKCQETYAWGLRNPFRMAFDSNAASTRFYINEVGAHIWEEVDVGQPGADYGWNVREGMCANNSQTDCGLPPPGMTNPIHHYHHNSGCRAITGGAFVPSGIWPLKYESAYLYQDYICGKIFRLVPDGGEGFTASEFGSNFNANSLVGMTFGPNGPGQALYYITYNGPGFQVRRIVYTGAPGYRAPTGGTPVRMPLVTAFRPCAAPGDSTHGGSLPTAQSCKEPGVESSTVTPGNSTSGFARIAHARIIVCNTTAAGGCGSIGTVPDVRLFGNGSDIVCAPAAPPAACPGGEGSDYDPDATTGPNSAGLDPDTNPNTTVPTPICNPSPPNPADCAAGADMTAVAEIPDSTGSNGRAIRVTDTFNATSSPDDPPNCAITTSCSATVRDQGFPVPVVCQANADAGIGSYCGANTTANAVVPGVVVAGSNAIVEIGQIQVFDSGPDGVRNNADDQLVAAQGIFVP